LKINKLPRKSTAPCRCRSRAMECTQSLTIFCLSSEDWSPPLFPAASLRKGGKARTHDPHQKPSLLPDHFFPRSLPGSPATGLRRWGGSPPCSHVKLRSVSFLFNSVKTLLKFPQATLPIISRFQRILVPCLSPPNNDPAPDSPLPPVCSQGAISSQQVHFFAKMQKNLHFVWCKVVLTSLSSI
jgi:hypothetical protein